MNEADERRLRFLAGVAGTLACGATITLVNDGEWPEFLIQGTIDAERVYIGTHPETGDALVVVLAGELGIQIRLNRNEANFYCGSLWGSAWNDGR